MFVEEKMNEQDNTRAITTLSSSENVSFKTAKKLFVINSNLYIRNYLQSGVLESLDDGALYFIAHRNMVTLDDELKNLPNFLGFFSYKPRAHKRHYFLSFVLMHYFQKRSKTFRWKLEMMRDKLRTQWNPERARHSRTHRRLYKLFRLFCSSEKAAQYSLNAACGLLQLRIMCSPKKNKPFWHAFFGRPGFVQMFKAWFRAAVPPNAELEKLIADLQPDIVLFPSNAIDPVGNDLTRLQKKYGYQTLFLIDNWDNLSSKSVFITPPDYLTVWGQQSLEHARDIHRISTDRVFPIGTPRFEHYFQTMNQALESPYSFAYVLYVGCQVSFDELGSLKLLDKAIEELNQSGQLPCPLKIIYRPHPWRRPRQCPDRFNPDDYTHVQLDEQLKEQYYQYQFAKDKNVFQPALDYYPKLLKNACFVMGPLTTMLLEASLFHKPVMAIAYDDGIHFTNPKSALASYKHFEGLTELPGMSFAHEVAEMESLFKTMVLSSDKAIDWPRHETMLSYYLYRDEKSYTQRLKAVLEHILNVKSRVSEKLARP